MPSWTRSVLIGLAISTAVAPARAQQACQERVLSLRFTPPVGRANNWCWAASGQMIMELLGEPSKQACQCRQAEEVLGVTGCCVTPSSCLPADDLPARCDKPRWPAFVERPDLFTYGYRTTCDDLTGRQNDENCDSRPLEWAALTAELCAGRPVIASVRARGSSRGHTVVVKGFSSRPHRRVLILDPSRLCPADRDCEGELDEAFWISYDDYVSGWNGMAHWVDFYGIRRERREKAAARPSKARQVTNGNRDNPGRSRRPVERAPVEVAGR